VLAFADDRLQGLYNRSPFNSYAETAGNEIGLGACLDKCGALLTGHRCCSEAAELGTHEKDGLVVAARRSALQTSWQHTLKAGRSLCQPWTA
jgi:hypothetical protein